MGKVAPWLLTMIEGLYSDTHEQNMKKGTAHQTSDTEKVTVAARIALVKLS